MTEMFPASFTCALKRSSIIYGNQPGPADKIKNGCWGGGSKLVDSLKRIKKIRLKYLFIFAAYIGVGCQTRVGGPTFVL